MIGGVILTHGPMGPAIIKAAETILGSIDSIFELSTTNLSLTDICDRLKSKIASENCDDGTIIMVSLKGGSCWNAAVTISRQLPNIEVVSGVNLPMFISFVTKRNQVGLRELAEKIKFDGIRGIDHYEG
ncbi:MAG: PTS sugar transporter subunit IIA [Candidatus Zhuqueibacterota bacterium]|jgi:mannose/fructose-specific phosphotransferase system component IIA